MKQDYLKYFSFCLLFFVFISCGKDDEYVPIDEPEPESPVVLDLSQVPYEKLSDYNFFNGQIKDHTPVYGVIPFEPISSLFTDYAKKKRFVWMPKNVKATYASDGEILNFPVGTVLIKTFYYENVQPSNSQKIIETRLMIKKQEEWIFANYVWNEDQTEAFLDNQGSFVDITWIEGNETKNTNYRIPSAVECLTCHKRNELAIPIGTKPQSLNSMYTFSDGSKNQLAKWVEFGYLEGTGLPPNIQTVVKWDDVSQPLEMRVRSYVDINCAHCHSENSHCDYRPLRLAFNESADPVNLGVCIVPDEFVDNTFTYIVAAGNHQRSMLHYRLTINEENLRMPLLGRSIVHQEGADLIEQWINSMNNNCE